jgi:hypothetical protein
MPFVLQAAKAQEQQLSGQHKRAEAYRAEAESLNEQLTSTQVPLFPGIHFLALMPAPSFNVLALLIKLRLRSGVRQWAGCCNVLC